MDKKIVEYFDKPDEITEEEWDSILAKVVEKTLMDFSPKPDAITEEEWDRILAEVAAMPLSEWNKQKEKWEIVNFHTRKELNTWLREVGHPELIEKKERVSAGLSIK